MYSCILAVGHFGQECVWVSKNCVSKVRGSAGNEAAGRGLQQDVWQKCEDFQQELAQECDNVSKMRGSSVRGLAGSGAGV